jgi:hypothetical protein
MVLVVVVAVVWVMGWKSGFVFVIRRENEEWDIGGGGLWVFLSCEFVVVVVLVVAVTVVWGGRVA